MKTKGADWNLGASTKGQVLAMAPVDPKMKEEGPANPKSLSSLLQLTNTDFEDQQTWTGVTASVTDGYVTSKESP